MHISQAITNLQNLTKTKITYEQIALVLGVSKQAIGNRVKRNSELREYEFEKLKEYFCAENSPYTLDELGNSIKVDLYPDVFGSFSSGKFVFSQNKIQINIPKALINPYIPLKKYSVINAFGESMKPTINDNDKLIVEHIENEIIKDNHIYVFSYNKQIFVKRLICNVDRIIIKSDNSDIIYNPEFIGKDDINNINIIGRVVGLMRNSLN